MAVPNGSPERSSRRCTSVSSPRMNSRQSGTPTASRVVGAEERPVEERRVAGQELVAAEVARPIRRQRRPRRSGKASRCGVVLVDDQPATPRRGRGRGPPPGGWPARPASRRAPVVVGAPDPVGAPARGRAACRARSRRRRPRFACDGRYTVGRPQPADDRLGLRRRRRCRRRRRGRPAGSARRPRPGSRRRSAGPVPGDDDGRPRTRPARGRRGSGSARRSRVGALVGAQDVVAGARAA